VKRDYRIFRSLIRKDALVTIRFPFITYNDKNLYDADEEKIILKRAITNKSENLYYITFTNRVSRFQTPKSHPGPNIVHLKMATLASKENDVDPACFKRSS